MWGVEGAQQRARDLVHYMAWGDVTSIIDGVGDTKDRGVKRWVLTVGVLTTFWAGLAMLIWWLPTH